MKPNRPQTDEEWIIHAINIHGVFFERWCARTIAESSGWNVRATNLPVSFSPMGSGSAPKESALDIYAQQNVRHRPPLTLLVECKKNNPGFINWVFFAKDMVKAKLFLRELRIETQEGPRRYFPRFEAKDITDEAREVKGNYLAIKENDRTKTANQAVSEAAYQVALATHSVVEFEKHIGQKFAERNASPYHNQCFLPVIVTTANLHVCEFDPQEVLPSTGEVAFDKVKLSERQFLFYEYPLPPHLQMAPTDLVRTVKDGTLEYMHRMHILVVNAQAFSGVLAKLDTSVESILGTFLGETREVVA